MERSKRRILHLFLCVCGKESFSDDEMMRSAKLYRLAFVGCWF